MFIKYKFSDILNDILEEFNFLITVYDYSIIDRIEKNDGCGVIYNRNERKVDLTCEYRDIYFYFYLFKGKDTKYNDHDFENIKSFYDLFKKYEPDLDPKKLQPDKTQYLDALKLNAALLKKYGDKVLKGEEWI